MPEPDVPTRPLRAPPRRGPATSDPIMITSGSSWSAARANAAARSTSPRVSRWLMNDRRLVHESDLRFDRDQVLAARAIDQIDEGVQQRRFAARAGTGNQDEAIRLLAERLHFGGEPELLDRDRARWEHPEEDARPAVIAERQAAHTANFRHVAQPLHGPCCSASRRRGGASSVTSLSTSAAESVGSPSSGAISPSTRIIGLAARRQYRRRAACCGGAERLHQRGVLGWRKRAGEWLRLGLRSRERNHDGRCDSALTGVGAGGDGSLPLRSKTRQCDRAPAARGDGAQA